MKIILSTPMDTRKTFIAETDSGRCRLPSLRTPKSDKLLERVAAWGLAAGMLTGFSMAVLWVEAPPLNGLVYELGPALAAAMASIVVVSLMTEPKRAAPGRSMRGVCADKT